MNESEILASHVQSGLSASQKKLSSAWFYDDEGSRLFQRIMALPEYYLTGLEHQLLRERAGELARWIDPDNTPLDLIELGSGDGEKTLSLCQVLHANDLDCIYRPMDVSAHALAELSQRFDTHLPGFSIAPVLGDYFEHWPEACAERRQVAMLLGSIYSIIPSMFDTQVRFKGMALSYNLAVAMFAGTAPMINSWLIAKTGNPIVPAYYLIGAAVVGLIALLSSKDRTGMPMRGDPVQ